MCANPGAGGMRRKRRKSQQKRQRQQIWQRNVFSKPLLLYSTVFLAVLHLQYCSAVTCQKPVSFNQALKCLISPVPGVLVVFFFFRLPLYYAKISNIKKGRHVHGLFSIHAKYLFMLCHGSCFILCLRKTMAGL